MGIQKLRVELPESFSAAEAQIGPAIKSFEVGELACHTATRQTCINGSEIEAQDVREVNRNMVAPRRSGSQQRTQKAITKRSYRK